MGPLSYLNKYFLKYKYRMITGLIFIVISNLFAIVPAQIIREAINLVDRSLQGEETESRITLLNDVTQGMDLTGLLIFFAILVTAMAVMKGLFTFLTRQTIIIMSRLIEYDLKNEIYTHYQVLSPSFYRHNNTGDIMNRISEDVTRVRMYLGPGVMYSINMVVLFTLVIVTMLSINVKLTLYSLLPLPALSAIIYYVSNVINRKSEEVQHQLSDISSAAQESFSGIRVLKSYVREAHAIRQYDIKSEEYKRRALSLVKVESLFMPVMLLLIGLSTILTVYIGGLEAIAGKIEIGNIAEFVIYVNMLTWPVTAIGWVTSLTQRASASQRRINEFLDTSPEIIEYEGLKPLFKGQIEVRELSYRYEDSGTQAIRDVSFKIEPGQSLGIIGRTGAGKTSLVDLLSRNLIADSGQILYDGIAIENLEIRNLRNQMGIVPQEGFLFSDTINGNIAFGSNKLVESEVKIFQAAKDAVVYDNIMSFPEQFETLVGERGITLSGGQKQRISIARALVRDPKILIFDDCLSAVDTVTESKILKNLRRKIDGKTSIIISHRVSAVKTADQIMVMENGTVAEQGKHKELIERKGLYYEMHLQQKLEKEEDYQLSDRA
ncbi:MAG: ABC transporter ATP-binding protein [Vicingaceae bacterium]